MKKVFKWFGGVLRGWFSPCNRLMVRNIQPEWPWVDRDHLFFHAAFTVVADFVEQEMNGAAGLEQYISRLEQMRTQPQTDREDAFLVNQIQDHQQMLGLYEWYTSIDWNEPVPHTATYSQLLEQLQITSVPLENGTYKMQFEGVDQEMLARERAMQVAREQEFEAVKIKNLMDLTKIYHRLWN